MIVYGTDSERLADVERAHVLRILALAGGNISEAARRLGIFRSSLQRRLRKYRQVAASEEREA